MIKAAFAQRFGGRWTSSGLVAAVLLVLAFVVTSGAGAPSGGDDWPEWASTLEKEALTLRLDAETENDRWLSRPVVSARSFGAKGDGINDDTSAIQSALDLLKTGGTVVLDDGRFIQSRCLILSHEAVRLVGKRASLHAINPKSMCIELRGVGNEVRDLSLTAQTVERGASPQGARILVTGHGARVVGNRIEGSTAAGIWAHGAQDYAIVQNEVSATLSDGIHNSDGANSGYISGNTTNMTGDDGIAVVSYRQTGRSGRFLITGNKVLNVKEARGISVIGSHDVIINKNEVSGTGRAAGIIVAREGSWNTYGVDRVIISDNVVTGVGNRFAIPFFRKTGHASIDLNADSTDPDLTVKDVLITGNSIADGSTGGIRLLGGVCQVLILKNRFQDLEGQSIEVASDACDKPLTRCAGNISDRDLPKQCS